MAEPSVRVDSWIWAVRLTKTRSQAAAACRGGHVKVNGTPAKPAQHVTVGDEVRLRIAGRDRIVEVVQVLTKRVGPPVAARSVTGRKHNPIGVQIKARDFRGHQQPVIPRRCPVRRAKHQRRFRQPVQIA